MSRKERAKQFLPFAALKGYPAALRRKEKIIVPKVEFSEDYQEQLDGKLRQIRVQDVVTAVYFREGEYLKVTGMVSRIDRTARVLKIVNTKIPFDDLYDVSYNE
nr:YolD-like family protein [Massilistercora timonensis]